MTETPAARARSADRPGGAGEGDVRSLGAGVCDDRIMDRPRRIGSDTGDPTSCPVPAQPIRDDRAGAELAARLGGIAGGDRQAFAEFYDRTSARVFGLATRIVRNPALAEEITQEVYLQVWTSAARQYDHTLASPIGWLLTLTHRRSVDRVRSEQSASDRNNVYGASNLGRDHDTVTEQVEQRFDEQRVTDCLDTLTATQREAIGLAYYSGRTYREVAEHLDVALPTVKSRIRDGLIRLKNCLGVNTDV